MENSTGGTQTNIYTTNILFPKDFIQNVLIDGIGRIYEISPYETFALIAIGIEYLGKCLDSTQLGWHNGSPQKDFERTINTLQSFELYRKYLKQYDIQNSLRNGFLHSFIPKDTLTLSSGLNGVPNLKEVDGKLNLKCGDFYQDFKLGCQEVINTEFKHDNNKMNKPFLSI